MLRIYIIIIIICVILCPPVVFAVTTLEYLRAAAKWRWRAAYRPGTRANQRISSYLKFCLTHGLPYVDPTPDVLCLYTEYLAQKLTSPKSVRNYLSAVKLYHNLLGVTPTHVTNFQFLLMLRALPLTMRQALLQHLPMPPSLLSQICSVCDLLGSTGMEAKCGFLLAFFGFLRQE